MKPVVIFSFVAASLLVFAGCRGVPTPGEQQARRELATVASHYQADNDHPVLPVLTPHSSLSNFLAFALLNSPAVKAAYYDWSASVENITVARSLPDPQLNLQAYLTDRLTSLMPGFAWNLPGPGKLKVRAGVATSESEGKYIVFANAVLQTAFDFKKAYYNLEMMDEQLRLNREILALLDEAQSSIRAQNASGQATLAAVLRVQSERDRMTTDLANLEDAHHSAMVADFKAALGFAPQQSEPPLPAHYDEDTANLSDDELQRIAFAHNPQLAAMAAEVRTAEAGLALADKERVPDFNAGMYAEVYTPPFFWPQAGMTLPIWRDKLAAEHQQASAGEMAAKSRLQAARIDLAMNFTEKSFTCRESARNLVLIEDKLLPQARQSVAITRAGYRAGTMGFASLTEAERAPLDLQLAAAEARNAHQIALAELSLMIAGVPPPGALALTNISQP